MTAPAEVPVTSRHVTSHARPAPELFLHVLGVAHTLAISVAEHGDEPVQMSVDLRDAVQRALSAKDADGAGLEGELLHAVARLEDVLNGVLRELRL